MEQISPLLRQRIEEQKSFNISNKTIVNGKNNILDGQNTTNVPAATNINVNNTNIQPLQNDVVEIQNKKISKKKALAIAAGVAIVAGVCIAAIKVNKVSKAKKEITALYDDIFDNLNQDVQGFLNFEKPKLVFKKTGKKCIGEYKPAFNEIHINPSLRDLSLLKDPNSVSTTELCDNLQVADAYYRKGNIVSSIKKWISGKYRTATPSETKALKGSVLRHELTHAKQFQMLLSSEGGKEKYIKNIKSISPNLSNSELEKLAPFIFNYRPKKMLPSNTQIIEKLPNGTKFKYNMQHILDAFTKYTDSNSDLLKYYTNLTEISARNAEYSYWEKLAKKQLPIADNLSEEFIKSNLVAAKYNSDVLMHAAV